MVLAQNGGFNSSGVALSPPGALSQRTDMAGQAPMQMPDAGYGEQQQFQQDQMGAPMAATPPMGGFLDPTQNPEEPLTAGAGYGPGPGPEVLPQDNVFKKDMTSIAKYLPQFKVLAADESTPESFRIFVRYLQGSR